ncbi:hypothetical protein, partial [Yersinia enterocolitica]|uniref:hypothetical protein n=1 Tax=Yersinia enterocolitica TaxID=630 RepID=UPI00313E976D
IKYYPIKKEPKDIICSCFYSQSYPQAGSLRSPCKNALFRTTMDAKIRLLLRAMAFLASDLDE